MTVKEFATRLFDETRDAAVLLTKITPQEAADDIANFRADHWMMPDDITPEEFADAWNDLVDAYMAQGADDDQT